MKFKTSLIFLVSLLAVFFFLFFYFNLDRFLSLNFLKNQKMTFIDHYHQKPLQTLTVYILVYVMVTALSIPGATLITILAGVLFGLVPGTLIVSFASSTGATLAFLTSRFFLKGWVQKKFNSSLKKINKGIEEEGAYYLFCLRLFPFFPFVLINLVMGITPMKVKTFFFSSQLGMLPASIVFVNAGSQLAQIQSVKELLSPSLLFSFCLLGLFPLMVKKIFKVKASGLFT